MERASPPTDRHSGRRFAVLVAGAMLLGCPRTNGTKENAADGDAAAPRSAEATDAAARSTSGDDAKGAITENETDPENAFPASWLAPRAIAALSKDCAAVPARKPGPPPAAWNIPANPFDCEPGFQPGQTIRPCNRDVRECQSRPSATCRECANGCRSSCSACAARCDAGGACRDACARETAECLQRCDDALHAAVGATCDALLERCQRQAPPKAGPPKAGPR
jgi:hypothetical protein